MKTTITVRLDERQRQALAQATRRLGKSASAIVREALDHALAEETVGARAGHVKGGIRLRQRTRVDWRSDLELSPILARRDRDRERRDDVPQF